MHVKIYHNPSCSKSRAALKMIRDKGVEPEIIEYLKTPPSRKELIELLNALGLGPVDILRKKEAREAGINPKKLDLTALVNRIIENPEVIERPIVTSPKGTRLCRPPETVLEIL